MSDSYDDYSRSRSREDAQEIGGAESREDNEERCKKYSCTTLQERLADERPTPICTMLTDHNRMAAYHVAIVGNSEVFNKAMDVVTGSGMLACWAAHAGAKRVYAVNVYGDGQNAQNVEGNGLDVGGRGCFAGRGLGTVWLDL